MILNHLPIAGALLIVACTRNGAATQPTSTTSKDAPQNSQAAAPEAKTATIPSKPDAEREARAWLGALRTRDAAKLQKLSVVPFELRELVEYPKCETTRVEKSEEIVRALGCLLEDDLLMGELAAQTEPVTEAVSSSDLPQWAESLKNASATGQLVQVRLPGDGVSFQFLLLTTQSGVTRVWKFAEFDPN
jgi:hypothetical protein